MSPIFCSNRDIQNIKPANTMLQNVFYIVK